MGKGHFIQNDIFSDGAEFTVVYDCGSSTIKGKKFEKKIHSTFPKNHPIDILFISHFDSDHVNGIEILKNHCKIKKVILPLIEPDVKILLKVSNFLKGNDSIFRLVDDPFTFFGSETDVVYVRGVEPDEPVNVESVIITSELKSGQIIQSAKVIKSSLPKHDWLFIPFNYKNETRKTQFVEKLSFAKLKLEDINTIEKIVTNKAILKTTYEAIDGDINENSMLLFSGKDSTDLLSSFNYHHFYPFFFRYSNVSCIYLGDSDLNKNDFVRDLRRRLGKLAAKIGTIQIPHHGSIENFNSEILNVIKPGCAVISFGTSNTYGHPSDRVVGEILSKNILLHLVTENQASIVVQWYKPNDSKST